LVDVTSSCGKGDARAGRKKWTAVANGWKEKTSDKVKWDRRGGKLSGGGRIVLGSGPKEKILCRLNIVKETSRTKNQSKRLLKAGESETALRNKAINT